MEAKFEPETVEKILEQRLKGESRSQLYEKILDEKQEETSAVILLFIGLSPHSVSNMTELSASECKRINILEERSNSVILYNKRKPIPEPLKDRVKKRDNERCVICGYQEKLHFHHIIPVSKGGENQSENLALLCLSCHKYVHGGNYSDQTIYKDKKAFWDLIVGN